jgi:hypothetical protein
MEQETTPVVTTLCPLCWRPETVKVEGDLPCVECQEGMKKGFLLIGVDFSRSDSTEKAIRTGHRWIVSVEAAKALYDNVAIEKGAGLLDIEEAKQLGLPVQTSGYPGPAEKKGPGLTLCGICNEPIHKDELGGIDKKHGFMHTKCMPLTLIS